MPISKFFIYALLDPDTYEIKYIGQSAQGISRFNFTMCKSALNIDSPKTIWVNNLLDKNKIPLFKIIEVCEYHELNQKEIEWISKYSNLLNVACGGIGGNTRKSHLKWKPVLSKNLETNEIKEYKCVHEVTKDGFSPTKVSAVCLGKRKSHKGHLFIHINESFKEKNISKPIFNTKKSVKRTDLKNSNIEIFDSIKLAAYDSNVSVSTVSNCCRGKSKCRNYNFEYM